MHIMHILYKNVENMQNKLILFVVISIGYNVLINIWIYINIRNSVVDLNQSTIFYKNLTFNW